MADAKTRAAEAKARGNAALSDKRFDDAIAAYTEAIAADPSDHVFFSNRSAAYLSKGDAAPALKDAEECVRLKGDWAKGHGRVGAALLALGRLDDAAAAYQRGLKLEPGNAACEKGLQEVDEAREARAFAQAPGGGGFPGGMRNPFGPDMFARLAANPKFLPYLADDAFTAKLRGLQTSAGSQSGLQAALSGDAMSDPRMLEVIMFLLGVDTAGMDAEGEDFGAPKPRATAAPAPAPAPAPARPAAAASATPAPAPASSAHNPQDASTSASAHAEPEVEMDDEEAKAKREAKRKAVAAKDEGNAAYKNRDFALALQKYRQAQELDPDEIIFFVNEGAVHFEQGDFQACIEACNRAVTRGREIRAPFASLAKAYARIGNAKARLADYPGAIEAYESSLLESHNDDVHAKLKAVRAEYKKAQDLAYRDPAKAAEAKERGNDAFKAGDFPKAVSEYSEAIKRDPDNAVYWTNRATAKCKLADFGSALSDVEKALNLDPKYVKAYIRQAAIQSLMKEYHKALDTYQKALAIEPDNAEAREGLGKVVQLINSSANSGNADPERAARAMADPEIQRIMTDPMVNVALEEMQRDPAAIQRVMRDPAMAVKIQKLISAGILGVK